jgi:putative phosphotransacetylase
MVNTKGLCSYCQDCGACRSVKQKQAGGEAELATLIVSEVLRTLSGSAQPLASKTLIPLGVSNRHMHLTKETFAKLFGQEAKLEVYRELLQEGEFASKSTCLVIGPKMRQIEAVRILGPFREEDQVELSRSDAVVLGIDAPVRESGNLQGSASITLVGPQGSVDLPAGAIVAARHVHMSPHDAQRMGLSNGERISVKLAGEKSAIFENVQVRVKDSFKLQMHLDTDEANAAGARCETQGEFLAKAEA